MLKQQLEKDMISALKEKQAEKLTFIRYILAQIKNKEIDKNSALSEDEIIIVLKKVAKELSESIEAFKKGNRLDLTAQSEAQLTIIKTYLPSEISDEELKIEVEKIVANNQELYKQKPKAIIGVCIKELKNKADPTRIMKMLNILIS